MSRILLPVLFTVSLGAVPAGASTRADNTTTLDQSGAWTGTIPGAAELAIWSGAYNTAGSLSAGFASNSTLSWLGIQIGSISGSAAGLVSIGGTGAAATGSQLTIGASGIDMSGSNQNAVINAVTISANTSQT